MKRFWKTAQAAAAEGGWTVVLDGRPIRTAGRNGLVVPNVKLAEAIVAEWDAVEDKVDPRAMPMTGLANAAIDIVASDKDAFADGLAKYATSELVCYRADFPEDLCAMQDAAWDPLIAWAAKRYDVALRKTRGIMHVDQPGETLERLQAAVRAHDAFTLAGLSPLVTVGGSLVAALAVLEGAIAPEEAWDAVEVDARHQAAKWGADADAVKRDEGRRAEFLAAARFLDLLA